MRLAAWSSAIRTRSGLHARAMAQERIGEGDDVAALALCRQPSRAMPGCGARAVASASTACSSNGSSTQKRLPMFSLLSNPIEPPIASVRPLAMVVPRPVPPCRRARLLSACSKASNSFARAAAGMPMPVSETVKRSRWRPSAGRCHRLDDQAHLAGRGELDRVAEQVEQHLAQVAGIAAQCDRHVLRRSSTT